MRYQPSILYMFFFLISPDNCHVGNFFSFKTKNYKNYRSKIDSRGIVL